MDSNSASVDESALYNSRTEINQRSDPIDATLDELMASVGANAEAGNTAKIFSERDEDRAPRIHTAPSTPLPGTRKQYDNPSAATAACRLSKP